MLIQLLTWRWTFSTGHRRCRSAYILLVQICRIRMCGYLPLDVDVAGSSTVSKWAESSTRQINAVSGRAARAGILNGDGNTVALATNAVSATSVGDENLAATVLGGVWRALPGGSKSGNEVAISVLLATRSVSTLLVVNSSETGVTKVGC